jgi:hypothetical protein
MISVALVKFTDWGIAGIAAGELTATAICFTLLIPIVACNKCGLPWPRYRNQVWLRPLGCIFASLSITLSIKDAFLIKSIVGVLLCSFLLLTINLLIVIIIGLSQVEKAILFRKIKEKFAALSVKALSSFHA